MRIRGRWYGVRGHRFVRPALILTGDDGSERRLLADLDDKPWVAEDGENWRAAFAVESEQEIVGADGLELSVAPNINVALRTGGVDADGPITATGRVSEEPSPLSASSSEPARAAVAAAKAPDADKPEGEKATPEPQAEKPTPESQAGTPAREPQAEKPAPKPEPERSALTVTREASAPEDPDLPFPTSPRRRRARGVPPTPSPAPAAATASGAAETATPETAPASAPPARPRPTAGRAADLERLSSRLRSAEATLEREHVRREEVEQSLERERSDARRTVAELARVRAELELARTAESEAADTASQLDAARRDNHELRARHESLRADHERTLRSQAELEEKLQARTDELQEARKELSTERKQRREADSRAASAADAAEEAGHRPPAFHATVHTPPPPRTDRPVNPSLRQSPWLRLLVVLVIAGVLLAIYLVLHSTVWH